MAAPWRGQRGRERPLTRGRRATARRPLKGRAGPERARAAWRSFATLAPP